MAEVVGAVLGFLILFSTLWTMVMIAWRSKK